MRPYIYKSAHFTKYYSFHLNKHTGRDSICILPLRGKINVATSVCTGGSDMPPACRTAMGSSPTAYKKFQIPEWVSGIFGTPEGTRTPNPRNRNPMLYPLSHRCIFDYGIIADLFCFVKRAFQKNSNPFSPFF